MKTKIKYESSKRRKELENVKKAYKKYADRIDKPVEQSVYEVLDLYFNKTHYPKAFIQGKTSLYNFLESVYHVAGDYKCLLYNDMNAAFQYLKTAAKYHAMSYAMFSSGISARSMVEDSLCDPEQHEKFLYQAISVGEWELAKSNATPCPIIQAMLNADYQKARELLLLDTEESDEMQEPYFIHMPYVKRIYFAILDGDEKEFNEQLAKRINKYRRRPSDYQPIVDVASIALIKFAKRIGLNTLFQVEEVPTYFLEAEHPEERTDCKIVNLEQCEQIFQKWGDTIPTLEEIRRELFEEK